MAPPWLSPMPEHVPDPLRKLGWVQWRAELQPPTEKNPTPKDRKVLYQTAFPMRKASSTDPRTWASFEDTVEAHASLRDRPPHPTLGGFAGIGVVLPPGGGITCIDLDHVLDRDDRLDPRAAKIVADCSSWTERSPSNTGLHVFLLGHVLRAIVDHPVEIYSEARFMCITGHRWPGTPATLEDRQEYLDHLVTLHAQTQTTRATYTGPALPPPDDLQGALCDKLQAWAVPIRAIKLWADSVLAELVACPWAEEHTTGPEGAVVIIHPSGAFDFSCRHAHCGARGWRDFRAVMEPR